MAYLIQALEAYCTRLGWTITPPELSPQEIIVANDLKFAYTVEYKVTSKFVSPDAQGWIGYLDLFPTPTVVLCPCPTGNTLTMRQREEISKRLLAHFLKLQRYTWNKLSPNCND